ncbi:MAG TPA: PAS domain-containing protein [Bryobacteraceae bacterium]|nr:PAS domain-containing protein [Bryobacteraceae bacterium]
MLQRIDNNILRKQKLGHITSQRGYIRELVDYALQQVNTETLELPSSKENRPRAFPETAFRSIDELKRMMDDYPYPNWAASPNNECIYVNLALRRFTGREIENFLGLGWTKMLHPDDKERVYRRCRDGFRSRLPFQCWYRFFRTDGLYGLIEDYAHPFYQKPNGELGGYIGLMDVRLVEADLSIPQESVFPLHVD